MAETRRLHLPDFCAPKAVLAVLLIVGLTALVLALSRIGGSPGFWTDLARTSLFLVWVGLAGAGLLCAARVPIGRLDVIPGTAFALLLITAPVAIVSEAAFRLGASEFMGLDGMSNVFPRDHWPFVLRNVATGLVIAGLALRYFYVTHQWRLNIEAQARSRVNALQARIRPHFLYNSMNTIAALTRSNPAQAEEAVQDLADLFRANLSEKRSQITLKEELEVARIYQRIEQLRLGDRLRVSWQVQGLPMRALVPSLTVQPLLENAIGHGIETLAGGGEVIVHGDVDDGLIVLTVRNPLPLDGTGSSRSGHGFALANIRERLTLMYGPRADVIATRQGDEYLVRLRFPHVEAAREGAA